MSSELPLSCTLGAGFFLICPVKQETDMTAPTHEATPRSAEKFPVRFFALICYPAVLD